MPHKQKTVPNGTVQLKLKLFGCKQICDGRRNISRGSGKPYDQSDHGDDNENAEVRSCVVSLIDVVRADRVANKEYLSDERYCVKDLQSKIFPRGHRLKFIRNVVFHDKLSLKCLFALRAYL